LGGCLIRPGALRMPLIGTEGRDGWGWLGGSGVWPRPDDLPALVFVFKCFPSIEMAIYNGSPHLGTDRRRARPSQTRMMLL
jgi:hypothetical protein